MTSTEMRDSFLLRYDINGNAAVGFTDDEVYEFLSTAQVKIVQDIYKSYGVKLLKNLVSVASAQLTANATGCYYTCDISDFDSNHGLYIHDANVKVTRTGFPTVTDEIVYIDIVNPELRRKFECSTFNKTVFLRPKLLWGKDVGKATSNNTLLYVDSYTTIDTENNAMSYSYIKRPDAITALNNPVIDLMWHEDIVDKAVFMAITTTGDSRTQEENLIEKNNL